jgi:hypothetical protein
MAKANSEVHTSYTTVAEALKAAENRFEKRNAKSLELHKKAAKSLPGGNTRSVLHTVPCPVFLKSGRDYHVTSEDGHIYVDLVGEFTAALYGHSQPLIQQALISTCCSHMRTVPSRLDPIHELRYRGQSSCDTRCEALHWKTQSRGIHRGVSWRMLYVSRRATCRELRGHRRLDHCQV